MTKTGEGVLLNLVPIMVGVVADAGAGIFAATPTRRRPWSAEARQRAKDRADYYERWCAERGLPIPKRHPSL